MATVRENPTGPSSRPKCTVAIPPDAMPVVQHVPAEDDAGQTAAPRAVVIDSKCTRRARSATRRSC